MLGIQFLGKLGHSKVTHMLWNLESYVNAQAEHVP